MQVDIVAKSADTVRSTVFCEYSRLLKRPSPLRHSIDNKIEEWEWQSRKNLAIASPFNNSELELRKLERLIKGSRSRSILHAAVYQFFTLCESSKQPVDKDFWHSQLGQFPNGLLSEGLNGKDLVKKFNVCGRHLIESWQKALDKARSEWELEYISNLRRQLLDEIELLLKLLEQIQPIFDSLGIDPGLLIDFSNGQLNQQDFIEFQRWAKYLSEDEGLRSLCDLLGRVRQFELAEKLERANVTQQLDITLPDIHSNEEIIGIRLGRDLENVLPSEKALLADEVTSLLFDLKYVESRLMCFDMVGHSHQTLEVETEQDILVKDNDSHGPMIVCVDTSGSMSEMPETIAKGVALFMAAKAKKENRPCYLINFSTGIQTLDLTGEMGLASIIDFLKMSFHGGTDVGPALSHALEIMDTEVYKKADLLVISDFIVGHLCADTLKRIEAQRENGNRFYSLVVGDIFMSRRQESLFDHEWVFNPISGSINELVGFQQYLGQQI
ncbi:VWA domain-containing protein [Pseudoalteromonas sp. CO325X]|uniref:VWA domain-containing protein n=1 Tax=Pseudoalteromonas sp. CO325X TaxID=1777262 RepID=UPI0010232698|nr:VWA domain-containing protein [Pseudoalteromonas sp. CO325X]RZF80538.1 VWA domain-containing protein [Pseudoalteromonas sp. CO325X]